MKKRKHILLADCSAEGVAPFSKHLLINGEHLEVKQHIANWKRNGKASELRRYAKYFGVPFMYFLCRKKYSTIVGWQQFYALIYCFYCTLFHARKANTVIALNFTYKEKRGRFAKPYKWFMSKCLSERYMDYVHVLSEQYAEAVSEEFGFPKERIIVTGFGVEDRYDQLIELAPPAGLERDKYALAIGRSNRDYDFLIDAWSEIKYPLVIISDTYHGKSENPEIKLVDNVAGEEANAWIRNCGLMIIPIDDGRICSGDTVLLTAMSLKKKIIVTAPSTLAEMYVKDGENAILTPKEKRMFRNIVQKVLTDSRYDGVGEAARDCFLSNFTLECMGRRITELLSANGERTLS